MGISTTRRVYLAKMKLVAILQICFVGMTLAAPTQPKSPKAIDFDYYEYNVDNADEQYRVRRSPQEELRRAGPPAPAYAEEFRVRRSPQIYPPAPYHPPQPYVRTASRPALFK